MTEDQRLSSKITPVVQAAIAQAIERHRRLGEAIAIWRNGKVVIVDAAQIPELQVEQHQKTSAID